MLRARRVGEGGGWNHKEHKNHKEFEPKMDPDTRWGWDWGALWTRMFFGARCAGQPESRTTNGSRHPLRSGLAHE